MGTNVNLKVGDLVWGKMRSYPPWPGRVLDPPQDKKVHVFFYGTKDHAYLPEKDVRLHSEDSLDLCKIEKNKSLRKALRDFQKEQDNSATSSSEEQEGHTMQPRPATVSATLKTKLKLMHPPPKKRKITPKPNVSRRKDPKPGTSRCIPADLPYNLRPKVVTESVPEPIPESVPEPIPEPVPEPIPELAPEPIPELAPEPMPEPLRFPEPEREFRDRGNMILVPLSEFVNVPSGTFLPVPENIQDLECEVCFDSKYRGVTDKKCSTPCCQSTYHMSCVIIRNKDQEPKRCPNCSAILDIGLRIRMPEHQEISFAYEFFRRGEEGLFVPI